MTGVHSQLAVPRDRLAAAAAVRRAQPLSRAAGQLARVAGRVRLRLGRWLPACVRRGAELLLAASLLLLLAPVVAPLAAACWLTEGSCLRSRLVLGRGGRPLRLWELALPAASSASPGCRHDRPHPIFRLARGAGLQHYPALWSVVLGRLAWVGPRPAPRRLAGGRRPASLRRLDDRPGLVCLWWIRQRANIDFDSEGEADFEYCESRSLLGDAAIACRAAWVSLVAGRRRPSSAAAPARLRVLGLPIRNVSLDEAVEQLAGVLEAGLPDSNGPDSNGPDSNGPDSNGPDSNGPAVQAAFINADCANLACRDPMYRELLQRLDWNYADGIGMKLAARWQGAAVRQNVNGTDLFPRLLARMELSRQGVYLLGGEPGVAAGVGQWIAEHYPGVELCGTSHGYFSAEEQPELIERINRSGAELLLVAMGAPRQDRWIAAQLPRLQVRLAMGVGGLFDFYSGRRPRAPQWLREMGLEWCYRLWLEPGRLWRRYLIGNGLFLARVLFSRRRSDDSSTRNST